MSNISSDITDWQDCAFTVVLPRWSLHSVQLLQHIYRQSIPDVVLSLVFLQPSDYRVWWALGFRQEPECLSMICPLTAHFVWLPYYTAANHVIPDQSNIDTCKFEMNYRFKDIFQEVYEESWKEKFEENSIWFVLIYPDFDYDCFSRMTDNLYMMHIGMSTGWLMTW